MMNSKALKEPRKLLMMSSCGCPDECDPECGYVGRFFHAIGRFIMFRLYYPVESFFRRTKERLGRSYDYARFGWLNYDFDMARVWDLFEFKLKRLYKCLENGHAIQEPEDMKALREFIKTVRRLGRGCYEDKYYKLHDKRWGKLKSRTEPASYDKNGKVLTYKWISWRKNCPENAPEKLKKQEIKDRRKIWENAEKDRVRDINRMAELIIKHGFKWWD